MRAEFAGRAWGARAGVGTGRAGVLQAPGARGTGRRARRARSAADEQAQARAAGERAAGVRAAGAQATRRAAAGAAWAWPGALAGLVWGSCSQFGF